MRFITALEKLCGSGFIPHPDFDSLRMRLITRKNRIHINAVNRINVIYIRYTMHLCFVIIQIITARY